MRSKTADAAARRLRPTFIAATILLVLLLGVLAYALAHSQSQQRSDINRRFEDRARVAATVNEALFSLATSSARATDAQRFGDQTVNQAALSARTTVQQQLYAAILGPDGSVLANTGAVPPDIASKPGVKAAYKSSQVIYS